MICNEKFKASVLLSESVVSTGEDESLLHPTISKIDNNSNFFIFSPLLDM